MGSPNSIAFHLEPFLLHVRGLFLRVGMLTHHASLFIGMRHPNCCHSFHGGNKLGQCGQSLAQYAGATKCLLGTDWLNFYYGKQCLGTYNAFVTISCHLVIDIIVSLSWMPSTPGFSRVAQMVSLSKDLQVFLTVDAVDSWYTTCYRLLSFSSNHFCFSKILSLWQIWLH